MSRTKSRTLLEEVFCHAIEAKKITPVTSGDIGSLYKQVKDPNLIGSLSGHVEGSRAFVRYRNIDEETKKELVSMLD